VSEERATSYPQVTLRPARSEGTDNDLEFLVRVYADARAEEMELAVGWSPAQKDAFLHSQFDLQHRHYHSHYPNARYDLIYRAGRPIGRYYVAPMENEIRIMDIALLLEERGRGIGERLVRDVLEEAARSSLFVSLHVEETNRAKHLYERLGFADARDVGVYKLMHWLPAQPKTAS
jgi:ribosomal protein S18 acetylase RimI-like enzyme